MFFKHPVDFTNFPSYHRLFLKFYTFLKILLELAAPSNNNFAVNKFKLPKEFQVLDFKHIKLLY